MTGLLGERQENPIDVITRHVARKLQADGGNVRRLVDLDPPDRTDLAETVSNELGAGLAACLLDDELDRHGS